LAGKGEKTRKVGGRESTKGMLKKKIRGNSIGKKLLGGATHVLKRGKKHLQGEKRKVTGVSSVSDPDKGGRNFRGEV